MAAKVLEGPQNLWNSCPWACFEGLSAWVLGLAAVPRRYCVVTFAVSNFSLELFQGYYQDNCGVSTLFSMCGNREICPSGNTSRSGCLPMKSVSGCGRSSQKKRMNYPVLFKICLIWNSHKMDHNWIYHILRLFQHKTKWMRNLRARYCRNGRW